MSIRTIIQGDSDWADVSRSDGTVMDSNWTGQWAIVSTIGGTALASGSMTLSTDNYSLRRRTAPADTLPLAVGEYWLITQIDNATLEFSKEIKQERIKIVAKGI